MGKARENRWGKLAGSDILSRPSFQTPRQVRHASHDSHTTVTGLVYIRIVYYTYFEWDAAKSDANLAERAFDFAFATQVFEGPTLDMADQRRVYGEPRMVSIGVAQGWFLTVVWTDRVAPDGTTRRRIISARRSDDREREGWRESAGG